MARATKTETELLEIHRRLVRQHITQQTNFTPKAIRLTMKLYDICISGDNIKNFYFRSVKLFTVALITDRLDEIKDYTYSENYEPAE